MSLVVTAQEFIDESTELGYTSGDLTTVSGILLRAQARAESFLEYSLIRETKSERLEINVNVDNDLVIHPSKKPVRSVSSVTLKKGSFNASVTLNDSLDIYEDAIYINGSDVSYTGEVYIDFRNLKSYKVFADIVYNCGYYKEELPADIKLAIFLYARDEISRKLNTTGATSISQGSLSISYSQRSGKSELIQDAESMLMPYKRVTGW